MGRSRKQSIWILIQLQTIDNARRGGYDGRKETEHDRIFILRRLDAHCNGEKIKLMIWGKSVEEATKRVVMALGGCSGEYAWTGSGPEYENNAPISREI